MALASYHAAATITHHPTRLNGPVVEFRPRVLGAGPSSYLGIMEGLPDILVHSVTPEQAEGDLVRVLIDRLERMMDREATRLGGDDFPTVREVRLSLSVTTS